MLILIRGVSSFNQGAELMAVAAVSAIRKRFPRATIALPYAVRALALKDLDPKVVRCFSSQRFDAFCAFIPRRLWGIWRFIRMLFETRFDVVLDASGFALGDQWTSRSVAGTEFAIDFYKRRGTTVILLPQAFGPFEKNYSRRVMTRILKTGDLIFARDKTSLSYLIGLNVGSENLKMAPDFTNLVQGVRLPEFHIFKDRVCIIPNARMLDKTSVEVGDAYLQTLHFIVERLLQKKCPFFFLIHEQGDDLEIIKYLEDLFHSVFDIVTPKTSIEAKGIIGECRALIASRYHALVSGLSQGVPCLATGWSHKYEELFSDYQVEPYLLDLQLAPEINHRTISNFLNPDTQNEIKRKILLSSEAQMKLSELMWNDVQTLILKSV